MSTNHFSITVLQTLRVEAQPHRKPATRQMTSSHSGMPNNNPANPCAGGEASHSAVMSLQRQKISIRN
jgi:hypothetical protein